MSQGMPTDCTCRMGMDQNQRTIFIHIWREWTPIHQLLCCTHWALTQDFLIVQCCHFSLQLCWNLAAHGDHLRMSDTGMNFGHEATAMPYWGERSSSIENGFLFVHYIWGHRSQDCCQSSHLADNVPFCKPSSDHEACLCSGLSKLHWRSTACLYRMQNYPHVANGDE